LLSIKLCGLVQEIAEPLSDLKQGIEELRRNRTLKSVLAALLAVGNFLNGVEVHIKIKT